MNVVDQPRIAGGSNPPAPERLNTRWIAPPNSYNVRPGGRATGLKRIALDVHHTGEKKR